MNEDQDPQSSWPRRIALFAVIASGIAIAAMLFISHADGPVFIFAGGPFTSGERVELDAIDWTELDRLTELELEIVAEATSLTLWFSVHDGVPYVACDLDCVGGRLERWPQQIAKDDRIAVRIDGKRADGRLVHVPHETAEYVSVRAGRNQKYSGDGGGRAAAETAAHGTVVEVGEILTGRAAREEPGDRLYRIAPR